MRCTQFLGSCHTLALWEAGCNKATHFIAIGELLGFTDFIVYLSVCPEVCATDTVVALVDLHTSLQGSIRANGSVGLLLNCC